MVTCSITDGTVTAIVENIPKNLYTITKYESNKKSAIVQFMRQGSPARDGIPSLNSDGEALPEVACLPSVPGDERDTPAELGDKSLTLHPPGS